MVHNPPFLGVAALCFVASVVWGRSAARLARSQVNIAEYLRRRGRTDHDGDRDALHLARSAHLKSLHLAFLYGVVGAAALAAAFLRAPWAGWPFVGVGFLVVVTVAAGGKLMREARLIEARATLEHRAQEVLAQQELAPLRWSERLAPERLPDIEGFEIAHHYQPGAGAMAGDFYDIFPTSPNRLAAAIGDVTGHGVDPSITAFQVKNLLRVFLRQFRDPGQVLEELNAVVSAQGQAQGRNEEMVSVCLVVFDQLAGSLRFASAGHPAAWLFHAGDVRPLRATGPILALDPHATYFSREIPMEQGDVLLLYTDGLVEARSGQELFGEERVASALARDPRQPVTALCASLVETARDFAAQPFSDDVAVLAIKCG